MKHKALEVKCEKWSFEMFDRNGLMITFRVLKRILQIRFKIQFVFSIFRVHYNLHVLYPQDSTRKWKFIQIKKFHILLYMWVNTVQYDLKRIESMQYPLPYLPLSTKLGRNKSWETYAGSTKPRGRLTILWSVFCGLWNTKFIKIAFMLAFFYTITSLSNFISLYTIPSPLFYKSNQSINQFIIP